MKVTVLCGGVGAARLLLRASHLLETELADPDGAWGALLRATTFAPSFQEALTTVFASGR